MIILQAQLFSFFLTVIISSFEVVWGNVTMFGFCEEQCASCVEGVPLHISKQNSQPQQKNKKSPIGVCSMANRIGVEVG
jgi:hypothetical protein